MSANEKTINTFATRVRQMILKFEDIRLENAELYAMVDERDAKIKELEEKLTQAKHDYDSLKMAKMMTISDNDMEATQKRIIKAGQKVPRRSRAAPGAISCRALQPAGHGTRTGEGA